jgi:hypothetical protein
MLAVFDIHEMTIDEKKETYNKYYEEYKKQKDVLT